MIKVQYIPIITDITLKDGEEVSLQGATLKCLLKQLSSMYGEELRDLLWNPVTQKRSPYVLTVVNTDLIHDENFPLQEDDTVLIMPALAGG